MPKVIKKRVAKKKLVQETEVKGVAIQALDFIKERQKQIIIAVSAIVVIVILYIIFAIYSFSLNKKAYSLEREAYNYYYGVNIDKSISEEDRWKKALEMYKKSIDVKATPTALYYLGNCYFNLGDYDNAIKQYSIFVDKFKGSKGIMPLVYQKLASAYFKTDKNDKALESLDKLAEVEDGIFKDTALIFEARYYETAGESEKALEKYRQVFTEFPMSPWSAEANAKVSTAEAKQTKATSEEAEVKKEEKVEAQTEEPTTK